MVRVRSVVGARPHFMKAPIISKEPREHREECLVYAGQHDDFEMSRILFGELPLPVPNCNVDK